MSNLIFLIFLTGVVTLSSSGYAYTSEDWAKISKPSHSVVSQSIGTYNAGCINGAVELNKEGTGYQLMRLSRKRVFGHADLKRFIEKLGLITAQHHWGVLLVGDLGQPRGGPTLSGHRSHQTGLDVDIWFLLDKQAEKRSLTLSERENWSASSVLKGNSDALDPEKWLEANEKILHTSAELPEVDRIFVNPSIKRELCRKHRGQGLWLRKIRPWWKHDDHFHVRLKCPALNPHCALQEPLPPGEGCDASLAWWFSAEAKTPSKIKSEPYKPPKLPDLCSAVFEAR